VFSSYLADTLHASGRPSPDMLSVTTTTFAETLVVSTFIVQVPCPLLMEPSDNTHLIIGLVAGSHPDTDPFNVHSVERQVFSSGSMRPTGHSSIREAKVVGGPLQIPIVHKQQKLRKSFLSRIVAPHLQCFFNSAFQYWL